MKILILTDKQAAILRELAEGLESAATDPVLQAEENAEFAALLATFDQ